jgi:uncharacterized OsmC-like protein
MPTALVVYRGELRTACTHQASQTEILTDAPVDNHGKGQAFSPTDLVATALGACMMTIMGIVAERHGWNLEGTQIEVQKVMSANPPRRIAEIFLQLTFPAGDYPEQKRQILENAARTCPVALSLHPDLQQFYHFNYPQG